MKTRTLLAPFGALYSVVTDVRNALYDRTLFNVHDLGVPTISVGNLTVGGTGKTPLVAAIARMLIDEGETVCILTRGYGRREPKERVLVADGKTLLVDAETGGDEPVELAKSLGGKAVIIADADRVAAAGWASEKFSPSVFILDDGFQHRRARRDLDIVCLDARSPFGNGRVLPAGPLRERKEGLARADAVVLTRSNLLDAPTDAADLAREVAQNAKLFRASTEIADLVPLEGLVNGTSADMQGVDASTVRGAAFCGLGDPEAFFETLRRAGVDVAATRTFPDHHRYTPVDIRKLEAKAAENNANALITTAKDAVKFARGEFSIPCYVATLNVTIEPADEFRSLVLAAVRH